MAASPVIRHEVHYGERVVRCFVERPTNLGQLLREAGARAPDRDAVVLGERRLSYRELDAGVTRIAASLLRLGLKPGDRVALLLGNGLEFVQMALATARAGLIAVPMNIRQKRPEIEFVLNQCGAAALVYDAEHAHNLPARDATPDLRLVVVAGEGDGATPFAELLRPGNVPAFPDPAEEDVYCLLYTSGTTGRPKGAKLTHFSVIHSLLHYRYALDLREGEVSILAVPASHVTGLVAIILQMVLVAGTTVLMPAFKARLFLEAAAASRMTYTIIVPAMYNLCLLDPEVAKFDLSAWRIAGFGGAPMPEATIGRLAEIMPALTLVNCYGATETSSPATVLPLGAIAGHPASVGVALPCADIVVVDEKGREVAPGESGELLIGGSMVVPGYWDNREADRAGFVGGRWISGDIGSIDGDGFVYVFDRKKDMINRAGYKIYCTEVESVMAHHPAIVECAVVGKPDPVLGERVHAFAFCAERAADAEEIRAFCAERLSDYKVPDTVIFTAEPLPRNANGKVVKTILRQRLGA